MRYEGYGHKHKSDMQHTLLNTLAVSMTTTEPLNTCILLVNKTTHIDAWSFQSSYSCSELDVHSLGRQQWQHPNKMK